MSFTSHLIAIIVIFLLKIARALFECNSKGHEINIRIRHCVNAVWSRSFLSAKFLFMMISTNSSIHKIHRIILNFYVYEYLHTTFCLSLLSSLNKTDLDITDGHIILIGIVIPFKRWTIILSVTSFSSLISFLFIMLPFFIAN